MQWWRHFRILVDLTWNDSIVQNHLVADYSASALTLYWLNVELSRQTKTYINHHYTTVFQHGPLNCGLLAHNQGNFDSQHPCINESALYKGELDATHKHVDEWPRYGEVADKTDKTEARIYETTKQPIFLWIRMLDNEKARWTRTLPTEVNWLWKPHKSYDYKK